MARLAQKLLLRLERWIDLPPDVSQSDKLRVRLICVTCACFMLMDLVCFAGAYWAFDGFAKQHAVIALGLIGKSYVILMLKFTRNPTLLGWIFASTSITGIWIATFIDNIGRTGTFEIGAAYTPFMIVSLVFVSLIGTKKSTLYYASLCIATLIAFFAVGSLYVYQSGVTAHGKLGLVLRCTAIFMTASIMLPVSQIIFGTLKKMESAVSRARAAELARMDFLSTMSHEIRTPLHGIIGLSDMLARSDLQGEQGRYASLIQTSSENLMEIVNEVLDMAKLEDGTIEITHEPFDPRELISNLSDLFAIKASEKGLWLGYDIDQNIPVELLGDAPHLRQVLSNLTGNAIKFTESGGVRVGARIVGNHHDHTLVQFYVQDSGVGISAEQQLTVFDRFAQADSSKASQTKGTGLGLAICQHLTEMMGGQLSLSSELGRGTVFHFTLAMTAVEMQEPPKHIETETPKQALPQQDAA